jgi:hypothetical protein
VRQNIIFEVVSKDQKDLEDASAGKRIKNKVINKFSCTFRSKSARSTLASPGIIRDNDTSLLQDLKKAAVEQIFIIVIC